MNSRGYQKTSRNPPVYPDIPVPQRNTGDNYYEGAKKSSTSREFHTGIFTS
jgi:hypothetical protein